jgi:hypothetical protein
MISEKEANESICEETKASNDPELFRQIEQIETLANECKFDEAIKICQIIRNNPTINFNNLSKKQQDTIIDVEETMKHLDEVCKLLDDEEGWTVENSNPQITAKYKQFPGSDSYTLKFEGELNFPIFNMFSLVYEIEFFPEFIPFCSKSSCVKRINILIY